MSAAGFARGPAASPFGSVDPGALRFPGEVNACQATLPRPKLPKRPPKLSN